MSIQQGTFLQNFIHLTLQHSIDIMHSNSKRPFVNSHLYVYVDGKEKLNTQLKFPNLSEVSIISTVNDYVDLEIQCETDISRYSRLILLILKK